MKKGLPILTLIGALFFGSAGTFAQSTFGTISGVVTDQSAAVVKGAAVEVKNQSTNAVREVLSDAEGVYQAVNLDPDTYTITIKASGFADSVHKDIVVLARETRRIDQQLSVAGVSTTSIEVHEAVVSESLTRSDSKSGSEIGSLALNFRATRLRTFSLIPPETSPSPASFRPRRPSRWMAFRPRTSVRAAPTPMYFPPWRASRNSA
jgi:hypothetical protein